MYATNTPKSQFVVYCLDSSKEALRGLHELGLPGWLKLITLETDVNSLESLPEADLVLAYGILEYVDEMRLPHFIKMASGAVNVGGYLVVVTLVKGEGALEIAGEVTRPADVYTRLLDSLSNLQFLDDPVVSKRPDRHDLGRGYPEDHLHWVYRAVLSKTATSAGSSEL